MKRNNFIYGMMAAATLLAASCTDFDDYNTANQSGTAESSVTLWDNISSRSDLSEFAGLVKKAGFDKELSGTRFYTVWAPENGSFDFNTYDQMDSATLVDRFIKSNVADYNYVLSSAVDERVHVLNEKSFNFQSEDGGTFGGNKILTSNIPSLNGTLHITDGAVHYLPNIYEYIFDNAAVDSSLAAYFKKYETVTLDEENSVVGPIDSLGQQTYSDSVMIVENTLFSASNIDAELDHEDSIYTMIYPTEDAYTKAYDRIKSYFKYADVTSYYTINSSSGTKQTRSVANGNYDAEYLADSIAKLDIAQALVLSHGDTRNFWLDEVGRQAEHNPAYRDTLRTTAWTYLSNGADVIAQTVGEPEEVSNGYIRKVDSLAFYPWDVWCPEIHVSMDPPFSQNTTQVQRRSIAPSNFNYECGDYISSYLDVVPRSTSNPKVHFYIPGVRSTKYNLYIVFMPTNITVGSTETPQLLKFNVGVNYTESADGDIGTLSKPTFDFDDTDFETDSAHLTKIDTFFVGEIEFPYAYYGIDNSECMPSLYVQVVRSYSERESYTNRMRIAAIILRPVEYDEYLKNEDQVL